jgi:hypothetical protein
MAMWWRRCLTLSLILTLCAFQAHAADQFLPDPKLTPGAVLTTDRAIICQPGYSKSVRHTSGRLKHEIYLEYGINKEGGHYEIDHLIPLSIGGADVRENLWPESRNTQPWNANVKDKLENYLHNEVCAGRIQVEEAQKAMSSDW